MCSEILVDSPGNPCKSQSWRRKGRLWREGFAEKEGFKPGTNEWGGDEWWEWWADGRSATLETRWVTLIVFGLSLPSSYFTSHCSWYIVVNGESHFSYLWVRLATRSLSMTCVYLPRNTSFIHMLNEPSRLYTPALQSITTPWPVLILPSHGG